MELDRLSRGEQIAAVSALLLFVFMFFDWFGVEVSGVPGFSGEVAGGGGSAWDALDVIPIFLMAAIVVAIGVAVVRLTEADLEPPISLNAIVAALGTLAALLILYRIVDQPGSGASDFGGVEVDVTLKVGIFLAFAAAIGIAYGGYSAMSEEGLTFTDVGDQLPSGGGPAGGPDQPGPGGSPRDGEPGRAGTPPPPPPRGQQPPPPPPPPGS